MKDLYQFAIHLAEEAGRITLKYFQKEIEVESKADQSPVTIADRLAEEYIRVEVEKHFPQDGIVGEEYGIKEGTSGRRWILDPIDGTKSFIRGVPLYGTMICAAWDDAPQVGVVRYPPLGVTIAAENGKGCFANGERCRVSTTASLKDASIVATSFNDMITHQSEESVLKLLKNSAMQRTWGDCYGYYLLATGQVDGFVDPIVQPWDIAAIVPIIREAGGRITNVNGDENPWMNNAIASNGLIHDELLAIFR